MEQPGQPPKRDYFKVKNDWWDALIKHRLAGEQRQVLDYIIRMTYGWRRKIVELSIKEFVQATGIKAPNICRAINSLEEKRMINVIKNDNRRCPTYQFNKYFTKWKTLSKVITTKNVIKSDNKSLSKMITSVIKSDNGHLLKKDSTKDSIKDIYEKNGFGTFWKTYPIRKGKQKAFEKWESLKKKNQLPPLEEILTAINDQIKEREIQSNIPDKFIPEWKNPATWLNQHCWTDECNLEKPKTRREIWEAELGLNKS